MLCTMAQLTWHPEQNLVQSAQTPKPHNCLILSGCFFKVTLCGLLLHSNRKLTALATYKDKSSSSAVRKQKSWRWGPVFKCKSSRIPDKVEFSSIAFSSNEFSSIAYYNKSRGLVGKRCNGDIWAKESQVSLNLEHCRNSSPLSGRN